jgi:hypothetical protein
MQFIISNIFAMLDSIANPTRRLAFVITVKMITWAIMLIIFNSRIDLREFYKKRKI